MEAFIEKLAKALWEFDCVEKVILFGSRARGDQGSRSDIDLAIVCPSASWNDLRGPRAVVRDARTLLNIDLVWFEQASKEMREQITREGKILYEHR